MRGNKILIGFGAVGLKVGRIKNTQKSLMQLMEVLNPILAGNGFLDGAPFGRISVIVREGFKYSETIEIEKIDRRHKELPVAFEVPLDELRLASVDHLCEIYMKYTLQILEAVSVKFDLDGKVIEKLREDLGLSSEPSSFPTA